MARLSGLSYGFIDSRNLEKQIWTTLGLENCWLKTWTLGEKTLWANEKSRRKDEKAEDWRIFGGVARCPMCLKIEDSLKLEVFIRVSRKCRPPCFLGVGGVANACPLKINGWFRCIFY